MKWSQRLEQWSFYGVLGLAFLLPLFVLPLSTDWHEINKQTLLVFGVCFIALLFLGSELFERRIVWKRSFFQLFPLFLLVAIGLSAVFSQSPFLSWIGSSQQEYTSFLTYAALTVLLFVLLNQLTLKRLTSLVMVLLSGGVLVGLIGLGSLVGLDVASFPSDEMLFNTVGTVNAFAVYLIAVSVLAKLLFLRGIKMGPLWLQTGLVILLNVITALVLIAIDYAALWWLFLLSAVVVLGLSFYKAAEIVWWRYFLPFIAIVLSLAFLFVLASPFTQTIPVEVSPGLSMSVEIGQKSLETYSAWFGSGPGTFVYDFAHFKSATLNQTAFWDTRFDRAYSFMLTNYATIGLVGLFSWLAFLLFTFSLGIWQMLTKRRQEREMLMVVFSSWVIVSLSFFLFSANMTLLFLFFVLSAMLGWFTAFDPKDRREQKSAKRRVETFALFFIALFVLVFGGFFTAQRYLAHRAYDYGLQATQTSEAMDLFGKAATLNGWYDGYQRAFALTAVSVVQDSLDVVNDEMSLSPYVLASVAAVERSIQLVPINALNWQAAGKVYREFLSVSPDYPEKAIAAYQTAISLEPSHPQYWVELGQTYLAMALIEEEEVEEIGQDPYASVERAQFLQTAKTSFETAVGLKPDYASAHYHLALTYQQQGDLNEAVGKMESVSAYNQSDAGVWFQLGLLYLYRQSAGDLDRAGEAFAEAITLVPSYANAHWYLATVYEQKGLLEYAIVEVETVLQLDPGNALALQRLERLNRGEIEGEISLEKLL